MPHFTVEYSKNIEKDMDLEGLLSQIHLAVVKTDICPLGGIRIRAVKRDHYIIADGDPLNSFVHVVARIREGRSIDLRKILGEAVMGAISDHLQPLYDIRPLAISFELQEIDKNMSFKKNNIHEYLENKKARLDE